MTDLFKEKSQDWDAREMVLQLSAAVGTSVLEHVPLAASMTAALAIASALRDSIFSSTFSSEGMS